MRVWITWEHQSGADPRIVDAWVSEALAIESARLTAAASAGLYSGQVRVVETGRQSSRPVFVIKQLHAHLGEGYLDDGWGEVRRYYVTDEAVQGDVVTALGKVTA